MRTKRKGFRVLLADPPWQFGDKLPGESRGAEKNYDVLDIEGIRRFPLPPLMDDAILFMWRVSAMVEEAYSVVRAWGFVPKSEIVWVKRTAPHRPVVLDGFGTFTAEERERMIIAAPMHFGMGRYVRASHETCIIATRGRFKVDSRSVRSVFENPVGEHSAKPDVFYHLVEKLAETGPYCELFARRKREGWTQYGNQLAGAEARP